MTGCLSLLPEKKSSVADDAVFSFYKRKVVKRLRNFFLYAVLSISSGTSYAQPCQGQLALQLESGEHWWGGNVSEGHLGPFGSFSFSANLLGDNKGNQSQPLLVSDHGRYLWCDKPFAFAFRHDSLLISGACDSIQVSREGSTLKEAYLQAQRRFFPSTGKMPDTLLFSRPQWNTWIELTYHQNQSDILKYAHSIIDNGFSPGVLMIDDTWQEDYGVWNFHPGRFPDPAAMMQELHAMGFKVMLWVCPFVSADSPPYRLLKGQKAFLMDEKGREPAMVPWWNGVSAVLDLSSPEAIGWFKMQLDRLQQLYHVDGFKFDAGDSYFYVSPNHSRKEVLPNVQTALYGQLGLSYPLNEYRAMWKMGGQPLAERLADKNHSWEDLQKLIPQITTQALEGYSFTCPDMIGGGDYVSFLNLNTLDQDLVVRSAQCHALMPMMQFSVAPWRVLDPVHLEAVKKAVGLRGRKTALILELARRAAREGTPIVSCMEYVFPHQGYASVQDQFMLGDQLLVAPLLQKGTTSRVVLLPKGRWRGDDGKLYKGPLKLNVDVPLNRLPVFERIR